MACFLAFDLERWCSHLFSWCRGCHSRGYTGPYTAVNLESHSLVSILEVGVTALPLEVVSNRSNEDFVLLYSATKHSEVTESSGANQQVKNKLSLGTSVRWALLWARDTQSFSPSPLASKAEALNQFSVVCRFSSRGTVVSHR